ncbi:hypothetical protein BDV11DRAFT_169611 [Aspergillus similis]
MPPVKRKAPTKPWYEVEESRASQARKLRRRNASLRTDPFMFLGDTLAGRILGHLDDVRDFGCAEMVTTRWRDIVAWWVVEQCITTMHDSLDRRDRTQGHGHRAFVDVVGLLTDEEKNELRWGGQGGRAEKVKRDIKEEDVVKIPRVKAEFNELNRNEDMDGFLSDNKNGNVVKTRTEGESESGFLYWIKSEKGNHKDIGGADETARKYSIIKQAGAYLSSFNYPVSPKWARLMLSATAKRYVSLQKIAAGNASSGRSLENVDWVVSAGEYVAWAEGPMICFQQLGFHSNGSLYPINRVNTRGWCDSKPEFWVSPGGYILIRGYDERERYFVDVCIRADTGNIAWSQTGIRLNPVLQQCTSTVVALTENKVYSLDVWDQTLTTKDLDTGNTLAIASLTNEALARLDTRCHAVRKTPDGQDVIVAFAPADPDAAVQGQIIHTQVDHPRDGRFYKIQGLQVINPETGAIRHFYRELVLWGSYGQVFPAWEKENEFAIISTADDSTEEYSGWKMEFFALENQATLTKLRTEVYVGNAEYHRKLAGDNPCIDPYRHLFFGANARGHHLPAIAPMQDSLPVDFRVAFRGGVWLDPDLRVDRWLKDDHEAAISLPKALRRDKERRSFSVGYRPWRAVLRLIGKDVLVLWYAPGTDGTQLGDSYLFDFHFRRPFFHSGMLKWEM